MKYFLLMTQLYSDALVLPIRYYSQTRFWQATDCTKNLRDAAKVESILTLAFKQSFAALSMTRRGGVFINTFIIDKNCSKRKQTNKKKLVEVKIYQVDTT